MIVTFALLFITGYCFELGDGIFTGSRVLQFFGTLPPPNDDHDTVLAALIKSGKSYSLTHKEFSADTSQGAIVIVDPFSTGAHLAEEVCKAGYACVRVFSSEDREYSPVAAKTRKDLEVDYSATIRHEDHDDDVDRAFEETLQHIKDLPFPVIAVIAGTETGIELADKLSHRLDLRSNGESNSFARRNKYIVGEYVRRAGVRAISQQLCTSEEDLDQFLSNVLTTPFKCVLKPVQSAGGEDVWFCNSKEEAQTAFSRILGKKNELGRLNYGVLAQEFLTGNEYIVDTVSKNGIHKVVAIWEHDKRAVNGAKFVNFGLRLLDPSLEVCQRLFECAEKVLHALQIGDGPAHMKLIDTSEGPALINVESCCHGGAGDWLKIVQECVGYTQVTLTLDVYENGPLFDSIDSNKYTFRKHGVEADIVVYTSGVLNSLPGEKLIRALPSFRSLSWNISPGNFLPKTICGSDIPGVVQLAHESKDQLEADFKTVLELSKKGLFDYTFICPVPPAVGAVVIVDPLSSGTKLAELVVKWGFRLILLFSQPDSPMERLIAKGISVHPTVQHDFYHTNQEEAIENTLDQLKELSKSTPIIAIMPGAERGVDLADKLAARFGTRNNGETMTAARRNKHLMQETVRAAGLRAIKQKHCRNNEDVKSFWNTLIDPKDPDNTRCVLKPNESVGSDSVYLCDSLEDALEALNRIQGKQNKCNQVNDGALMQEFIKGPEFVVDGVSRDGEYKCISIWEYDKRTANGANFVYFGMRLRSSKGKRERELMEYAKKVVAVMGIEHGPSHMEVMYTSDGPCLVEVGSRCHGGEATWFPIATECLGYTMIEAALAAYVRPDRFAALPDEPADMLKYGAEAFLVSTQTGVLKAIPGVDVIRGMTSFRRMEMFSQPGDEVTPTIDIYTRPGSVQMVSENEKDLETDYAKIRELEKSGLFKF